MKLKLFGLHLALILVLQPKLAYADFFGGDLPLLAQIVANTLLSGSTRQVIIEKGLKPSDYRFFHQKKSVPEVLGPCRKLTFLSK